MHQILVYADSLSWGIIPGTRERHAFNTRWPGVLEYGLAATGTQGIAVLIDAIRKAPIEPGMPTPAILIIAPPPM